MDQDNHTGYNYPVNNDIWLKLRRIFFRIIPYWSWIVIATIILILAFGVYTYFSYVGDLATTASLMNRNNVGLVLYDRNKKPIFKSEGVKDFEPIPLSEIPQNVKNATIAIEDKEFYEHPGFSVRAIIRSVLNNILTTSPTRYGGSTITQQLIKNALLTPEKSVQRKYQELILAYEVERRYSKDAILEMYLNSIYYGSGAYGIKEASEVYFKKQPSNLSLSESALLASLPQAPSRLNPYTGDKERLLLRKNTVLEEMQKLKYITLEEKNQAQKDEINFATPPSDQTNKLAPHFSLFVRDLLYKEYGEDTVIRSGFRVKTTLDISWQKAAVDILADQVKRLASQNVSNGALVTIDPNTGEVLVLAGSADYDNEVFGKYDVVFAKRQPGSSFKPIVYTRAFMESYKTTDILHDQPTDFAGYKPKNYDNKFRGDVTIRRALSNSLNVPSVELLQKVGIQNALDLAESMGITTLGDRSRFGLSLVLGGGEVELFELTRAYGVLANEGKLVPSHFILEITDKFDNQIYSYDPETQTEEKQNGNISLGNIINGLNNDELKKKRIGGSGESQIIDNASSFITTSILSDDRARSEIFGSGSALLLSRPAAAKTGTTDDYRDAWTIGYTPSYVTGVWIGNNDNSPMGRVAGSIGAAPIWNRVMESIHRGKTVRNFRKPSSIIEVAVCADNYQLACNDCPNKYTEVFRISDVPKNICPENITPSPSVSPTPEEIKPSPTNEPSPTEKPANTPSPSATSMPTPIPSTPTVTPDIIIIPST